MLINIFIILVSAAIVVVAYAVGEERGYRQGVDDVLDELESEDCDCLECQIEELEKALAQKEKAKKVVKEKSKKKK